MTAQPVCSVIIPSYRASSTIGQCLTALLRQDFAQPYEIVVVDSSPDETPQVIRQNFPTVHLVHLSQQTDPASARNLGVERAPGEALAFIDADCVAEPDWLRRLHAHLEAGYDAAGGAIANGNGETLISWAGYMCEFREFLPGGPARDADNLTLGNAAYRRAAFRAVGGFPTGYFPQEDQVFHERFRQRGYRIRLDPQIVVAHFHRADWNEFLRHQRHIGRVNAQVIQRLNLPGATLARHRWRAALALPLLVPLRFIRTLRACWRVERALVLRRPLLAGLCWLGQCWWGRGFVEGAGAPAH
jgi:GT2 family glycosyltransferase